MPTNFKRLRARLVLLVMLALVPAAALILHNASVEHDALLRGQREDNARLARLAAMQQARLIEGAHQLLIALARSPAVRSGSFDGCSEYLAELVAQYRWYSIFGVAAPNGDVVCHSRKPEGRVNIADRSYFRRALQTQAFTVGEYQIGRTSGQASFSLANPIRAADGTVAAVMFASVRMDEFDRLRSELALPPRAVLVTTDRNGVVLSFHPENPAMIGRKLPAGPLLDAALSGGSGTVDAPGVDGLERVYSYTTLDDVPDSGLFTAVGMAPEDMLHAARRELVFNLAGIAALIVLSFAAAIQAGKVLLLRPVEQLAAIVDSSEDAIVSKDLDGVITSWNAGAQRLFGYSPAEMIGTPITRLIPAERSGEEEQILARIRRGERVAHFETVRAARDGRLIDVSVTISPIRDAAGAIVGASKVARDISERKATQQALEAAKDRLHALSARLVQMHESERDSVSYELHDEVCQGLAAITMNVQSVQRHSPRPQLAECLRVADSLLQRVRALSAGLRPRELFELGLEAALRAHAERETAANGLALDMCSALGTTRLDRDLEATAFRIVEAALDNVVAHARARRVRLELELDAGELELAVTDDGIGFDVAAVCSSVAGTGIADMKHRAGLARGRVEILSSAGLGTRLTVILPLDTTLTATCVTDDAPA